MMLKIRTVATVGEEKKVRWLGEAQGYSQCTIFHDLSGGHINVLFAIFVKLCTYSLCIFLYVVLLQLKMLFKTKKNVIERAPRDT